MDEHAQRLSEGGRYKVVFVEQEDSAGPHTCRKYQEFKLKEFRKRDWILFPQPSQSPITNTNDAQFFPAISKRVSNEQHIQYGSRIMKGEELNRTVKKVVFDPRVLAPLARSYAAQHQIVGAIMEEEGDNKYLTARKGITFGIHSNFVETEDGKGVVRIPERVEEGESPREQIADDRARRGLKYSKPDLRTLDKANLTPEMKAFLMEHIDHDRMDEELEEVWLLINHEDNEPTFDERRSWFDRVDAGYQELMEEDSDDEEEEEAPAELTAPTDEEYQHSYNTRSRAR